MEQLQENVLKSCQCMVHWIYFWHYHRIDLYTILSKYYIGAEMKEVAHVSISLDKEYKKKLTYLAELEHRKLKQQIIHMTEFYLEHQIETRNLLEQFTQHQFEQGIIRPDFIDTRTKIKTTRQRRIKTSQVLQENKGIIVSDVPQKDAKGRFENQAEA